MRLTLIRHGRSEGNSRKLIQGHTDYDLDAVGEEEARLLGLRFKDELVDRIYVSDLKRAVQTAKPIIETHPEADVVFDERLRERDYGSYENRSKAELVREGRAPGAGTWIDVPEGEHLDAFTKRVMSMLDELWEKHQGERVIVVSHSGFLTRILLTLSNASDEEYQTYRPPNASVTIIEFDLEKNHSLHLMHCCEHLEGRETSTTKPTVEAER